MNIFYDDAPAGAGKTTRAVARMATQKTKTIYACERIEQAIEVMAMANAKARGVGTKPLFVTINSNVSETSVTQEIAALPKKFALFSHVIVFITHSAMMQMSDFTSFTDWSIMIEEVPSLIDTMSINTSLTMDHYRRSYTLEQIDAEWSIMGLTEFGRSLSVSDVARDDNLKSTDSDKLHARVLAAQNGHNTVVARVTDWDALDDRDHWFWANLFSMRDLSAFIDVTLLGNECFDSCQVHMVRAADAKFTTGDDINWINIPRPISATAVKKRHIQIRFYSYEFLSRSVLEGKNGADILHRVGRDLAQQGEMIWSANTGVLKPLKNSPAGILSKFIDATFLTPHQAGSNEYRSFDRAAIILAANPSNEQRSLMNMLGVESALWQRSFEHETMLQFSTRLSIRDADCERDVTITVFDDDDANYIAKYFRSLGHTADVEFVDIGIEIEREEAGRKRVLTDEERIENQKKAKREYAQRQRDKEKLENPKAKAKPKAKPKSKVKPKAKAKTPAKIKTKEAA